MIFQEKTLELKSSNNGNNRKVLDRKEKIVMSYIFVNCENGEKAKTRLFSSQEIVDVLAKRKYVVSTSELNEIMISLSKEGLIDFVQSESKKGSVFCVSLKEKGLLFKKDTQKERLHASWIILRTALLAVLSFVVGLLLRAIF